MYGWICICVMCVHTLSLDKPPFFEERPDRRLSHSREVAFLSAYVAGVCGVECGHCVSALQRTLRYGRLMSHLFWAIWALIEAQTKRADIDWDYEAYARTRYALFWSTYRIESHL